MELPSNPTASMKNGAVPTAAPSSAGPLGSAQQEAEAPASADTAPSKSFHVSGAKGKAKEVKGKGAASGGWENGGGGSMAAVALAKAQAKAAAAAGGAGVAGASTGSTRYDWMPSLKGSSPSRECIRRVRNDIRSLMRDPVPGLFVYPDEELVTVVHALVTGPFDTPYEGGLFYFIMQCPDDYPHNPPRVRLMTTGGGTVRFNPNLYPNGKVCLSILGTWNGPRWTPVQSVSSVLLSIQSLMSEKPYHNEPGFEQATNPQDVKDYSDCITHETLRVAVCSMVGDSSLFRSMPECFRSLVRDLFLSFVPRYELVCEQNMHRDGEKMVDPFGQNKGIFRYAAIQSSFKQIAETIQSESASSPEDDPNRASEESAESAVTESEASSGFEAKKACPEEGAGPEEGESASSSGQVVAEDDALDVPR